MCIYIYIYIYIQLNIHKLHVSTQLNIHKLYTRKANNNYVRLAHPLTSKRDAFLRSWAPQEQDGVIPQLWYAKSWRVPGWLIRAVGTGDALLLRKPSTQPSKCTSKGTLRQGIELKHRNSLQKSLCPVVIRP